ncbi:glycosyltransferase family 39 protein [Persephonella atlantica]|uniref:Glycosyltransferase family 39 protein n=1 Tax=Persephonella atlantica TaxID=2699429 RepID=A0ABS1GFV9_9AQUI|nr:glycosyltransferase family 39 protein [Persephonella atlantica]MBK3331809.1 glycosyltransferase family 39 protein [Persephonella atlantica]
MEKSRFDKLVEDRWFLSLMLFFTVFVYFWNIWLNDIWIPNEAFYAEAAREMLQNGNFLDIYYNYEPRFNKPPMTYWLVAFSYLIFGVNEFATRLPIVLTALGSNLLVYLIGKELYGRKVALVSAAVMAFSFQFVINSRYASPEVPLTFFFTLTLYFFIVGYRRKNFVYILLSYLSLGLTVLTKGFPYIAVIGGIVIFYVLIENRFRWPQVWKDIRFLRLEIGLPLVIVVGFSWYLYMYLKFGSSFIETTLEETVKRAVGKKSQGLSDLFFYPVVILWGFLPYSLFFYYAAVRGIIDRKKELLFPAVWFGVMLIIFTIAKGKIPVYIIQAHGAMSLIVAYYLVNFSPKKLIDKIFYYGSLFVPVLVSSFAVGGMVYLFKLDYLYYVAAVFPFAFLLRYRELKILPFIAMLVLFFVFTVSVLPVVERFRPYDRIGMAINDNVPEKNIPLIIESWFWHNMPFYAQRKVFRDVPAKEIVKISQKKPVLALTTEKTYRQIDGAQVLWEGYLYKRGSESRFAILLKYVYRAIHGDYSGFEKRYLIYKGW